MQNTNNRLQQAWTREATIMQGFPNPKHPDGLWSGPEAVEDIKSQHVGV